jgi:serine phosphatase RsbU (regulator of sigma subunit)
LSDGNVAFNTLWNGIIITDERFKILSVINKDNGLKVNGVLSLIQDYQGNLWAGLDNGIVQVHYSSPVSLFSPESGITGNIKAIERFNGKLFIGTTDGLFIHNPDYKTLSGAFTKYSGFSKEIRSLCLAGDRLMVGTMDELFEITDNAKNLIERTEIYSLHYSEKLKILFISSKKDFSLLKYSEKWKELRNIPEITEEVVCFEESGSNDILTLWMGTSIQGVVRLKLSLELDYEVNKYNSDDGLMANSWVLPYKIDGDIVFSQRNGLLTFINEETIRAQLPDSLKNRPEFYTGYFDIYGNDCFKELKNQPFYLIKDTRERVYVNLDGEAGYFDKNDSCSFTKHPFCLTDIGKINTFYHEDDGTCWIGGDDGLVMFDEDFFKKYNVDFKALITGISCGAKDSVLWHGYADYRNPDHSKQAFRNKVILPYKLNTINITYAAPFFEGEDKILFSFMLSGQDTSYSNWNRENRIVFRNLREGEYVFTVRAMNAYGHISSEASFEFKIMSPWFRTTWAYIIYIILLLLTIYTGIRLYTRRLIALNKRLENTVKERTHEIHVKNLELERQKKEILDSINYAQRIQNAVLPHEELIHEWIGDHFIIFRPKDIVSGDFYWATTYNQFAIYCVADCTGHGVPGAFMSMLCISLLNEVVLKEKIIHPEKVLNKVRKMVIESLQQKGMTGEQKDGMDISICFYNRESGELQFSGANNPLYIIREKSNETIPCFKQIENSNYILYEIKGDRMPVAYYDNMEPFKRHTIKIQKNDILYLFSDGICDQFGGPHGKRFMNTLFKATLLETITSEIRNQKFKIENRIDEWQAYIDPKTGQIYEQVDDICLMGIKI